MPISNYSATDKRMTVTEGMTAKPIDGKN
jgi:hypothetical protein